ncbi:MAG: CBS domain-containing protein [Candidatus Omnitrophica bacterium]|nr:CBS domain-containing protein [Candidatus Omnitrophota bacterium]
MKWSFKIGSIFGIPIRVHFTFILLLIFIGISGGREDFLRGIQGVIFVIAIFGCVIIHEIAHSSLARYFGINVKEMVLLPIGGVSQIEELPKDPKKEIIISIAGPFVSFFFAFIFYIVAKGPFLIKENAILYSRSFWMRLFWINLILGIFNLIPAFPMDGGRVLRSLFALRLNYLKATKIAVGVGQFIAILLFFFGIFYNLWLALIAMFIYIGAETEEKTTELKATISHVPVKKAMIENIDTLKPSDTLKEVIHKSYHSLQKDFPVVERGKVVGLILHDKILSLLHNYSEDTKVEEVMLKNFISVNEKDLLDSAFKKMNESEISTLVVLDKEKLKGLISFEQIGKYHMLSSISR